MFALFRENLLRSAGGGGGAAHPHELVFGALRTDDVLAVRDEALAGHGHFAEGADEALRMPVTTLK